MLGGSLKAGGVPMAKTAISAAQRNVFKRHNWPPLLYGCADHGITGGKTRYIGTAEGLIKAGVLRPQDTPGNPACPNKWGRWGYCNGIRFGAMRLGDKILVELYGHERGDGEADDDDDEEPED